MLKRFFCYCQYILPQHCLSILLGKLANSKKPWLKNWFIDYFYSKYNIDLSEALIEDPHAYSTFNEFFTRKLKENIRPIDKLENGMVSPADGAVAEFGSIRHQQLIQAKGMYFDLTSLLGGQTELADRFDNGCFATIYLAPHNYHRVHMPLSGNLRQTIYVPGDLFSVNRMTTQLIPNLYARNERLILIFDTEFGPIAVILVGALIVGSMQTVWMDHPIRHKEIQVTTPKETLQFEKGAELGQFQLGSTVIVLMSADFAAEWTIAKDINIMTGQLIAKLRIP